METGVLYCNDNLERLAELPSESVSLIYLDPPFFSNRTYQVIWGDEAEVRSFEDRWEGGIQHYIEWMRARAKQMHRVLNQTGSLYFHCDPHASHYLKVMLDEVFGAAMFRSEIIWRRTNIHNDAKRWSPVSDTILYYGKGSRVTWNPQRVPHSEDYLASKYRYTEPDGRRFRLSDMRSPSPRPNLRYDWKGWKPHPNGWAYSRETMAKLDAEGRIWYPDSKDRRPYLKRYLDEMPGVVLSNIWTDIDPLNSMAKERLLVGYPTQKPEALLERIIAASSNPGDIVLDPFCGCGTTVAVAERLGRRWVGIDISQSAIEIMNRRILRQTHGLVAPTIIDAPTTVDELKKLRPFEFQNWIVNAMHGEPSPRQTSDMGIDGYSFLTRDPIQVKQSEHVGRNVVDNFETAMRRGKYDTGYIVAFSFTRGAIEEVARARRDGLTIKLVRVQEVMLLKKRPDRTSEKLGPQPTTVDDLPIPRPRKPSELPKPEELVESDLRAASE